MLRDYQEWAIAEVWRYFENHEGNPIVVMPVGTGKSHVLAGMIWGMLKAYPRTRCMLLTHVKELIQQNYQKFLATWPNAPAGVYSAGLNKKEAFYPITFGGIGSVAKNADLFGHIDLIFIDECDLVSPKETTMYRKFINQLMEVNPKLKVIGLTATPWRTGSGSLIEADNSLFTDIAVDMSGVDAFNWFVDNGFLCPLVSKPTRLILDTDNLHIRAGDFVEKEMQDMYDKPEITRLALAEAMEVAEERYKWLIFATGVEHAKHIAHELQMLGISAEAVYSGMDSKARDKAINDYKFGTLRALVNNNILTTGFDAPATDLLVVLRATASSRLWVQMLGRGTRPFYTDGFDLETQEGRLASIAASQKHNCMVLDYSRNIERLGPINDPLIPRKKGKKTGQPAPVKMCPMCSIYNHASARYCGGKSPDHAEFNKENGCGYEFAFEVKFKANASTKEIVKQDELPIVQTFSVDHITYSMHFKVGAPPILKVTYYCGIKAFTDYICLQHPQGSPGRQRANRWWREREMEAHSEPPQTVEDALERTEYVKVPTHLDVWINTKYPQIKRYCFDGTAFGTQQVHDPAHVVMPTTDTKGVKTLTREAPASVPPLYDDMDDDIPF